ncbi:MAG: hypothetical protein ACLU62_06410 [Hydrogeniiclostridium sp.]
MEMTEIVERMAAMEQRAKSNSHRLDNLEALAEAIHHQGENIAVMCEQLKTQGNTLKEQNKRLTDLEDAPRHRWESIIAAVITGVVGIVLGLLFRGL